jgi:raffinose/stachyose/melibiose transport system permease protein
MSRNDVTVGKILLNVFILIFSLTCVFPIVWIAYTSLKTLPEYSKSALSLPHAPTFDNYLKIFKYTRFDIYFTNSVLVSVSTLTVVLLIAFVTGYFLSHYKFKSRNFIYAYFMVGMVIPTQAWLLPIFIQFKKLGILDRPFTLVLPYIAFALPTAIFLMESYVKGIPMEMEEAAIMEGCSWSRFMSSIMAPLCAPILSTITILSFNGSWNEFPFALVLLNSKELKTMPVALTMFSGAYTTNYTQMMAALTVAVLPVIIIYLLFSKQIIKGMTAGAVKE